MVRQFQVREGGAPFRRSFKEPFRMTVLWKDWSRHCQLMLGEVPARNTQLTPAQWALLGYPMAAENLTSGIKKELKWRRDHPNDWV